MTTRFLSFGVFIVSTFLLVNCKEAASKGIQDCPEEKIVNKMPGPIDNSKPKSYYIYKGARKELTDFDQDWVSKNCDVKETEVF